jgi:hypothetical protein
MKKGDPLRPALQPSAQKRADAAQDEPVEKEQRKRDLVFSDRGKEFPEKDKLADDGGDAENGYGKQDGENGGL